MNRRLVCNSSIFHSCLSPAPNCTKDTKRVFFNSSGLWSKPFNHDTWKQLLARWLSCSIWTKRQTLHLDAVLPFSFLKLFKNFRKCLELPKENRPKNPVCKRRALTLGGGITGWISASASIDFNAWVVAKAAMTIYFSRSSSKSCWNRGETWIFFSPCCIRMKIICLQGQSMFLTTLRHAGTVL